VAAEGVVEKEKAENDEKQGRKADFFVNFALDLFLAPNMKFAPIYRRWKRVTCLHEGKFFSPLFCWEGSQPLVQSSLPALSNL